METKLENILDSMMQNDNVVGALLSDNQGLCYGSKFFFCYDENNICLHILSIDSSWEDNTAIGLGIDNSYRRPGSQAAPKLKCTCCDSRKCRPVNTGLNVNIEYSLTKFYFTFSSVSISKHGFFTGAVYKTTSKKQTQNHPIKN